MEKGRTADAVLPGLQQGYQQPPIVSLSPSFWNTGWKWARVKNWLDQSNKRVVISRTKSNRLLDMFTRDQHSSTSLLIILMMGWSALSAILQVTPNWEERGDKLEQRDLSSHRNGLTSTSWSTSPAPRLQAPWSPVQAGCSHLGSSSVEKKLGILLDNELQVREQEALPAKAGNVIQVCVSKTKISLVLKTVLSMSFFCGFVNHIPYVTQI